MEPSSAQLRQNGASTPPLSESKDADYIDDVTTTTIVAANEKVTMSTTTIAVEPAEMENVSTATMVATTDEKLQQATQITEVSVA